MNGARVMFSTTDDRQLFVDVEDAKKIHELGLAVNEPFRILRRVQKGQPAYIVVSRVEQQQPVRASNTIPTAAASTEPAVSQPSALPKLTTIAHDMASCHIAAIDALLVSAEYARTKGLQLPITPESVHTTANTLYIQLMRNGGSR